MMNSLNFTNSFSFQQASLQTPKFGSKIMPSRKKSSPLHSSSMVSAKVTKHHKRKTFQVEAIGSSVEMVSSNGDDAGTTFQPEINVSRSDLYGDLSSSFSLDKQLFDKYTKEREELKEEVRCMLLAANSKPTQSINLINTLERLGVSYLFENEIEKQLEHLFFNAQAAGFKDYDLYTTAVYFRVLRQHGYNVSSDVFKEFKDENDKFNEKLSSDVKGMLSLYEAAHVRTHNETILDEALAFTTAHLKSLATHELSHPVAKEVIHALELPLHRGMPRLEARYYISFYQEDESRNETLLMLAKTDFNLLQLIYKQEFHHLMTWWNDLHSAPELAFVRQRMEVCYLWAVGILFEPQYALPRNIVFKMISLAVIFDDMYDSRGTLEELELFTDIIQRWDKCAIDRLPAYMKPCYKAVMDIFEEMEDEMRKQGRSYTVDYVKDAIKDTITAYNREAKWLVGGFAPSFDEYINVVVKTSNVDMFVTAAFMCMGEVADINAFNWIESEPKLLRASQAVGRFCDEVSIDEIEGRCGQTYTGIDYYMKDYGVSKQEAINEFYRRLENAWRDVNDECLKPIPISIHLKIRLVNVARIAYVTYRKYDGWNFPETGLNDHILAVLVDPIPI